MTAYLVLGCSVDFGIHSGAHPMAGHLRPTLWFCFQTSGTPNERWKGKTLINIQKERDSRDSRKKSFYGIYFGGKVQRGVELQGPTLKWPKVSHVIVIIN